uniref:Uncharacterized protein n=1 Tax=Zosterops lateralis melanops TaxID=1220523 RepID=A0A8D2PE28_ZOSLA
LGEISWTNTSLKNIPMISSRAEAARYPMYIDNVIVIMSCYLGKAKDWSCLRLWVNPWLNLSSCSSNAGSVQASRFKGFPGICRSFSHLSGLSTGPQRRCSELFNYLKLLETHADTCVYYA